MKVPGPTIREALDAYLASFQQLAQPSTKDILRQLVDRLAKQRLVEVGPDDWTAFVAGLSETSTRVWSYRWLRFAKWATQHYGVPIWAPVIIRQHPLSKADTLQRTQRILRNMELLPQVAERMKTPWQRAIFLLVFLHGWTMRQVAAATDRDVWALPQRRDLTAALDACRWHQTMWRGGWFRDWVGPNRQSANRHWRQWAGGLLTPTDVAELGDHHRRLNGVRPLYATHRERALPAMDEEKLTRLPTFWGR